MGRGEGVGMKGRRDGGGLSLILKLAFHEAE